jgi:hypothetical protein
MINMKFLLLNLFLFLAGLQSLALPATVELGAVQDMAWTQESHRIRLLTMAQKKLADRNFIESLLKLENIKGLNEQDIEDFRKFTLFRIANHDFKKGTFENSFGLSRIKGVDVARLNGQEKTVAKSIVNAVNDSGWFIEHKIHDFVFERDESGSLLTGAEAEKRKKLGELSAHFEHALDLHDRHMADKISSEWNRPMKKGSDWIDELVDNLNPKRLWLNSKESQEYKTLLATKRVSQFLENEIDGSHYRAMTKGLGVNDYKDFRRLKVSLDYSEILKIKNLSVETPKVLKPFLTQSGVIKQTNVELITKRILEFSSRSRVASVASAGRVVQGMSKIAEGIGRVAIPLQITYGAYVFASSGDLGKGFAAATGISDAGASDETSLYNSSQQQLFFSLSRQEQEKLLRSIPDFRDWLKSQFFDQPFETQMGLLCQDTSLSELFNLACVREIKCTGDLPAQISTEVYKDEIEKKIQLHFVDDRFGGKPQIHSLEIFGHGVLQQSFLLRSKQNQKNVSASNKSMKHWTLVNMGALQRICRKNNKVDAAAVLTFPINKESRATHSALNLLLDNLNQRFKSENSPVDFPKNTPINSK